MAPGSYNYTYTTTTTSNSTEEKKVNKLLSFVRLNKNQRKLHKAGVVDENGNLTDDGQELLLNVLLEDYETKLVALAKEFKDETKKKD